ncbi:MAG: 5'-methylthioadenosine/S-adenosylhomocysteine nucleosidase [Selenomonadaceae bacterium]|nr:5'-methylthioadenosine/S-adenosylhomocysteine nucleosidase [Selenomonadaceae bacterium]
MKKFFVLLIAALLWTTIPAQAELVNDSFASTTARIEEFYSTLPQAKGDYKVRQRPILIQGAMNVETDVLIHALKNPVAYRELNYLFVAGTYKNYPVVVVRTEEGLANAAASTVLAIRKFNPVAVINQGTAGGYDINLHVGDIVVGSLSVDTSAIKTAYSPAGSGIDFTRQEMFGTYAFDESSGNFQPYSEYHADTTLFNMAFAVANTHGNFNVVSGTIGTSGSWNNNVDYINFLREKYGTSCEDMETNAVAQICHTAGIPFLGIRVISNSAVTGEKFSVESATVAQNFVLLVVEDYVNKILRASKS